MFFIKTINYISSALFHPVPTIRLMINLKLKRFKLWLLISLREKFLFLEKKYIIEKKVSFLEKKILY
jgi:hypothetical protein